MNRLQVIKTRACTLLVACIVLISPISTVQATELQSPSSIQNAVTEHIFSQIGDTKKNIEIELGSVDNRLRLQKCAEPLDTVIRGRGEIRGRIAIAVSCTQPKRWKFYLSATVREFGNVVVPKQGIPRETVLSAGDVELKYIELTPLRQGYYAGVDDIIGMVAKRTLIAGKPISPRALNRRQLVNRGDKVTIRAVISGIEVRMNGEALVNGSNGERISVKNLSSDRIINAVVTAQGVVSVVL